MRKQENMISSYGSIYALGHKEVADIFDGPVEISEKTDGSQISWSVFDGELLIRSKNQPLYLGANNGMFNLAVERIEALSGSFQNNYVYRGEYLVKPKHNSLSYQRVPTNHIMIYDIEKGSGTEDYLLWEDRDREARRIGFEPVPVFYEGVCTLDHVKGCLEKESVLGGVKIEGVVVKNYSKFSEDKKVYKAKFVSTEFREKHQKEWKKSNPTRTDIIQQLIETYRVEARWQKSVQHLRDDGMLEGSPRDIGPLIKAAQEDLKKEEEEYIKEILFNHFIGQITRGAVAGLPDFYKRLLAEGDL